ncbi:MAG: hypothetical protein IT454_09480 [Planctomycetes bacterium]|nr:hypothetical protein [Planctomycetota bacterium]
MSFRLIALLALCTSPVVSSCCSMCCSSCESTATSAQELVEQVAARHSDVVRLTIHAVPAGGSEARAVASTVAEKRGKPSDPEDLKAMATAEPVVLQEGANVDVTLPLRGADGKPIGATGVTLANPNGLGQAQLVERAQGIARELESAIQAAKAPLW